MTSNNLSIWINLRIWLARLPMMIMDDFGNLVRPMAEKFAYAWVVFVSFVLIVGFVVLNLVVGIIVESINEIKERKNDKSL